MLLVMEWKDYFGSSRLEREHSTRGQKGKCTVVKHEKALLDRCSHLCVKENGTCLEQLKLALASWCFSQLLGFGIRDNWHWEHKQLYWVRQLEANAKCWEENISTLACGDISWNNLSDLSDLWSTWATGIVKLTVDFMYKFVSPHLELVWAGIGSVLWQGIPQLSYALCKGPFFFFWGCHWGCIVAASQRSVRWDSP